MTSAPIFYEYETFQLYNLVLVPPIFTFSPWPRLGLSPGLGATLAILGKLSERQLMITSIFDFLASLLRFHTPHTLLRIPYCIPTTLAAPLLQATALKLPKMHPVPPHHLTRAILKFCLVAKMGVSAVRPCSDLDALLPGIPLLHEDPEDLPALRCYCNSWSRLGVSIFSRLSRRRV